MDYAKPDLIIPLNNWLAVVEEEEINRELLVIETQALVTELRELCVGYGEYPNVKLHPFFSHGHRMIQEVIDLSGRFLWDYYTDSDTDAPCDIEWDLHHLHRDLHPGYEIPDDVEPAYVLGHLYDPPEEEE